MNNIEPTHEHQPKGTGAALAVFLTAITFATFAAWIVLR